MMNLGNIQRVSLREVWPNEARDFTPWLAGNIDKLGSALELDLEVQSASAEAPVGSFSLDVLAWESGSGRPVIIENQLEPTNHDHLGKLLTYAAGYDAYAVVWLTREFRDEHRQALDWLNQRTGENTAFFGVVVEAWRIDDSRPAPHFNLVVTPNDWQKQSLNSVRQGGGTGETSELKERYRQFFQDLVDTMREEHQFTKAKKAQPSNLITFSTGSTAIRYGANFTSSRMARVELYIDRLDREWNKQLFDQLLERQEAVETALGESLEWERLDSSKASRIAILRPGSIDDDLETLEAIQQWMVKHLLNFKRIFGPHLEELLH